MNDTQNMKPVFKSQAYEVETQTPGISDASLDEARRLIGLDYRWARLTVDITPYQLILDPEEST